MSDLWEPFRRRGDVPDPTTYRISLSGDIYELHAKEGTSRFYDPWVLLDALRGYLAHRALSSARGVVGLHASVLARGENALLLVGQPYAGKTTLMLELLQTGWSYVSDDLAPFRDPGGMVAFPKPPSVRSVEQWSALARDWDAARSLPSPAIVGLLPGRKLFGSPAGEIVPRWIVFPTYEKGVAPRLERMTPGLSTARCIQNVQNLVAAGRVAPRLLGRLCSSVPSTAISYGSTEAGLRLLEDAIAEKE